MAVRLFTRRQIIETARVKAEKLVTADALALLQKGWTNLRPSLESLKKADGDVDAIFDTWSNEFDKEFNDMLLRAAGILGDAEVSYWERRAKAGVVYAAQDIVDGRSEIIGRRAGKEIKSVPDATRSFVSAAVRSWYDSDESMMSLIERMSSYFQPWRAQRIAITEVTALASSVADNMMTQLGIDTWTWDSRNDMLVCPLCGSLHGQRFTKRDPMPPRHPECRCGTSILDKDMDSAFVGAGGVIPPPQTVSEMMRENPIASNDDPNRMKGAFESVKVSVSGDGNAIMKTNKVPPGFINSENPAHKEALAYEISKKLGLDIVPPTVIRTSPKGQDVSLQSWVEGGTPAGMLVFKEKRYNGEDFGKMSLLDGLIENNDRHAYNYLMTADGRIHAIDHGLSMNYAAADPRNYMMDAIDAGRIFGAGIDKFSNRLPLSAKYRDILSRIHQDGSLEKLVDKMLPQDETNRIEKIKMTSMRAEWIIDEWEKFFYEP